MTTYALIACADGRPWGASGFSTHPALAQVNWDAMAAPVIEHVIGALPTSWDVWVGVTTEWAAAFRALLPASRVVDVGEAVAGPADTAIRLVRAIGPKAEDQAVIVPPATVFTGDVRKVMEDPDADMTALVHWSHDPTWMHFDSLHTPTRVGPYANPHALSGLIGLKSARALGRAGIAAVSAGDHSGTWPPIINRIPGHWRLIQVDPPTVLDWSTSGALLATGATLV